MMDQFIGVLLERVLSASLLVGILVYLVLTYNRYLRELLEAQQSLIHELSGFTQEIRSLRDEVIALRDEVRRWNGRSSHVGGVDVLRGGSESNSMGGG